MSAPGHMPHDSQARKRFAHLCGAKQTVHRQTGELSIFRKKKTEENAGPPMPELQAGVARVTGLEPATSGVTGALQTRCRSVRP